MKTLLIGLLVAIVLLAGVGCGVNPCEDVLADDIQEMLILTIAIQIREGTPLFDLRRAIEDPQLGSIDCGNYLVDEAIARAD